MTLNERLKIIMRDRGLGIADLVRVSGIDRQTLHRMIHDETNPHMATIERLVAGLGMTMGEFYSVRRVSTAEVLTSQIRSILATAPRGRASPAAMTAYQLLEELPGNMSFRQLEDHLSTMRDIEIGYLSAIGIIIHSTSPHSEVVKTYRIKP